MSHEQFDRSPRNADSQKAKLENMAGDIELTPEDLGAVAGGDDQPTVHCTEDLPTLCPCASTIPESTCAV